MTPGIIKLRIIVRAVLAAILTISLVSALWLLLTELNDPDPTAALTALLGTSVGAIGTSLGILMNAIAANPSDRETE